MVLGVVFSGDTMEYLVGTISGDRVVMISGDSTYIYNY